MSDERVVKKLKIVEKLLLIIVSADNNDKMVLESLSTSPEQL